MGTVSGERAGTGTRLDSWQRPFTNVADPNATRVRSIGILSSARITAQELLNRIDGKRVKVTQKPAPLTARRRWGLIIEKEEPGGTVG